MTRVIRTPAPSLVGWPQSFCTTRRDESGGGVVVIRSLGGSARPDGPTLLGRPSRSQRARAPYYVRRLFPGRNVSDAFLPARKRCPTPESRPAVRIAGEWDRIGRIDGSAVADPRRSAALNQAPPRRDSWSPSFQSRR